MPQKDAPELRPLKQALLSIQKRLERAKEQARDAKYKYNLAVVEVGELEKQARKIHAAIRGVTPAVTQLEDRLRELGAEPED